MLLTNLAIAFSVAWNGSTADSARLLGDTVFIEPIGVRLTLPGLWLGRSAEARRTAAGQERLLCQYSVSGSVADRIVTDRVRLLALRDQARGHRQAYQAALDDVVPHSAAVAHVGGAPFSGGCGAPQIRVYIVDSTQAPPSDAGAVAQAAIERSFSGVTRTQVDSAGWRVTRMRWRVVEYDYIFPGTLDLWSRTVANRVVVVAVMDAWTAAGDVASVLSSLEIRGAPARELPNQRMELSKAGLSVAAARPPRSF